MIDRIYDRSIKSKIVIIVTVIFAFFITTSLFFSIYSLESGSKKDIVDYSNSERERTREALKSYVHIAYTAVENNYKNATDVKYLSDYYGERLRNMIDVVQNIIDEKSAAVKAGKMSKQQAQAQVLAIVNKMRYNKGLGYYFIFNRDKPYPKMVIEPMFPELNGKVLDDKKFNNASGSDKNLFLAASDLLVGNKETFIDYIWPRPDDKDSVDIAKFSYLRVYEDWDWVIGTGIYLDDAVKDCIKKSISDLREMRYANGTGYFWINDNTKPTPRLIMNPFLTELEGQILTDKKYNRAYGEDYNLYEAFLDACEETGDGFVDYSWDKPYNGSIIEDAPKISYVKYFKPLGWVIGSGVYVDDIDRAINTKTQKMNEQRKRLIVNYLLISLTLAVLSIGILVFLMNRYFKNIDKKNETVEDISETIPQNELQATTKNENPEIAATSTNGDKTDETPISEMGHLIGLILREQTKQLAMSRMADQELKEKTEAELKVMINEIKSILQNAKNGSSAT